MILERVLSRRDRFFRRPILAVTKVKIYVFKARWTEINTEGPLFLYQRRAVPQRRIVVFNTRRPRDFVVDLDRNLRYAFDGRFLMLKKDFVYGLWFYNEEEARGLRGLLGSPRGPGPHL